MGCNENNIVFPPGLLEALMRLPAFRYLKAPVDNPSELYEKYKDGLEKGTFSYVYNENTFYTWRFYSKKWKPISGGLSTLLDIADTSLLQEGDILVWSDEKQKFIVKSGNVWNKILKPFSQVAKFLNEVETIPTDQDKAGVYYVHNDIISGLYIVLAGKSIKIFNSSDWYTSQKTDELLSNKADRSEIENIVTGLIYQNPVQTINDLAITYPDAVKGWAAIVIDEKDELGNSYIFQFDGTKWNNTGLTSFSVDIVKRLLNLISYEDPILPIIVDPSKKILFAWDKSENKPIIPNLIKSLVGLVGFGSLDQDLKDKIGEIDILNKIVCFISNDNWLIAALDTSNKVLWGIDRDKRMFLAGQEITNNPYYGFVFESDSDWIVRISDKNYRVLWGINRDFKMFLAGQEITSNNYLGYVLESDNEWIVRISDKENKILWGINRDYRIFPIDSKLGDIQSSVNILTNSYEDIENRVQKLETDNSGDSSVILDVNYKGYFGSIESLLKDYDLKSINYVLASTVFRPTLLEYDSTITGNSDQRQWYANVGGYFAYTRWNGTAYEWYLSDTIFQSKPTLGMKIAIYNGNSLDSFIDEIKQAYLTNSVTIRTTPSAIIAFQPDLIIYPNAGFSEFKAGRTITQYLAVLTLDIPQYLNQIPQVSIVFYSAPNIDTNYKTWLSDILSKCNEYSIKFVDLNSQSGINNINKNSFLLDDATLNQIGSKRIAYRSLIEGEATERIGLSNKKSIPIIYIDTENGAFFDGKPKSTKMKMTRFEVDVRDSGLEGFVGTLVPDKDEIRGRGNTTWDMPKKPYRLKFDKKVSFFGNAPEKNWVLLALYFDKSSIRPSLCHRLGHYINKCRLTNGEEGWYVPTEQLVEVVINGRYDGLYCFTDHVSKVTDSRVNIPEPTPEDIATLDDTLGHYVLNSNIDIPVSGGFLIELEQDGRALNEMGEPIVDSNNIVTGSTGDVFIRPSYGTGQRYFACKSLEFYKKDYVITQAPNGIVLQSYMDYIQNFISQVNTLLTGSIGVVNGKSYKDRISEYIDIKSFIDYFFLMEIYKNPDSRDFSSIYYYKDRDKDENGTIVISPLRACPIWDVDLGAGNSRENPSMQNPEGWFVKGNVWTTAILRDSEIKQMFIDRWNELNLDSIWSEIMDELVTRSFDSALRDNTRWGNATTSYFLMQLPGFCPTKSKYYELELAYFRTWIKARINWINNNKNNL